jgi:Type II restriction endonuclease EcoO109I
MARMKTSKSTDATSNTIAKDAVAAELLSIVQKPLHKVSKEPELVKKISDLLSISEEKAHSILIAAEKLYVEKMTKRFSRLDVAKRLQRTNPFLLGIRGAKTVEDWSKLQVQSVLFASEEEAVGHLLEYIAKHCHPNAIFAERREDFDYEIEIGDTVYGYQVKMSWDCMPMSTRKNLSATILKFREKYEAMGKKFVGYFAPCYGRKKDGKVGKQEYHGLPSRKFWESVGNGKKDFDAKVGEVCALLCSEARQQIIKERLPDLIDRVAKAALPLIGDAQGNIDFVKLFKQVNK